MVCLPCKNELNQLLLVRLLLKSLDKVEWERKNFYLISVLKRK